MPFSPLTPSPHVWLDASQEAFANNDAVGTATDRSGNARDATQSVAGNKPTFKTSIINGQSTFYFATNDFLQFGDVFGSLTAAEVFIVLKRDLDPPVDNLDNSVDAGFWRMNAASGANTGSHVPWTDSNIYDGCFSTVRKSVGNPTPSLASPRVYNVISISGEWTANLDGTQLFTTATNTVSVPTTGDQGMAVLGRATGGATTQRFYYTGHFAEFLIYPSKLSTVNRNLLGGYFQTKYGITIAGATWPPAPLPFIPRQAVNRASTY